MNPTSSKPLKRFAELRRFAFILLLPAVLSGCATVLVRVEKPRPTRPPVTLDESLAVARASWQAASRGEAEATARYNAAVEQIVEDLVPGGFVSSDKLQIVRSGANVLNPSDHKTVFPASRVKIRRLLGRSVQPGIGVPLVLWAPKGSPVLRGQPGIPKAGMTRSATAVISFEKTVPRLTIYDAMNVEKVKLGGRRVPLAADFSAPLAVLLTHGANRSIDIEGMLFIQRNISSAGLVQLQPYDPKKIPVVFVHGLMSRPEAWTQATNHLLSDPKVRERYQFWYFSYPTGLPVWTSAAMLRSELDRFQKTLDPSDTNPNLNQKILIGHSMGGLISSLMIREGGRYLWSQFSDQDFDKVSLSPENMELLRRLIAFGARDDVSRVIFVATPHRGSPLALRPIAGFAAHLIQIPFSSMGQRERQEILALLRDDVRSLFVAPANSIRFLRAQSPLLLSILNLPLSRKVPHHSIIGDRGRGNTPQSTDGVVPYWSSHLDTAVSEKIVPSGHGANENAQGVEEMRRILNEAGH